MQDKLKPCPFCGNIPELNYNTEAKKYYIQCEMQECNIGAGTLWLEQADVVSDWNTRAADSINQALVDALKGNVNALKGVIRVADRKTIEFDAAHAAITTAEAALGVGIGKYALFKDGVQISPLCQDEKTAYGYAFGKGVYKKVDSGIEWDKSFEIKCVEAALALAGGESE